MNNGITKQIACQLFAWGYKLVDNANKEYEIICVDEGMLIVDSLKFVNFERIGKDFFILARSTDKLCEQIEGKVPLMECARIASNGNWELNSKFNWAVNKEYEQGFGFDGKDFEIFSTHNAVLKPIYNQQALFNHLYSLHFAINLPEGTWKEI